MGLALHGLGFVFLFLLNRRVGLELYRRLKPFLIFLPVMIGIYVLFSLGFSERSFHETLVDAGFGFLKLFLLIAIMMLFFVTAHSEDSVKVLRSIWWKTGLNWKWVEDFFLFLTITLRFYPAFQSDWKAIQSNRQLLGLKSPVNLLEKAKSSAEDLPCLLLYNLRRSERLAAAMHFRGYGQRFPRAVIHSMEFNRNHLFGIILILIFFIGIHWYAPI
jgi:energy-coupling factor transporter transmembrane protein EcfT